MPLIKLLIIFCSLRGGYGLRSYIFDFSSLKYDIDPKVMANLSLQLVDYKGRRAINGTYELHEDLQEFTMVNTVTRRHSSGRPRTVFNVTVNGCKALEMRGINGNPLITTFINELHKFMPDLPKKCPFQKHKVYSLCNLFLNEEAFPPYLPETQFAAFFGVMGKKSYFVKINVELRIVDKNKIKLKNKSFN